MKKPKKPREMSFVDAMSAIKLTLSLSFHAGRADMFITSAIHIITSVMPTFTAIIAGQAVNELIAAVSTHDVWPTLSKLALLFSIIIVNKLLNQFSSYRGQWMDYNTTLYVERIIAEKYARLPIAERETKEFADLFERVQGYSSDVRWIFSRLRGIIAYFVTFVSAFIAMLWVSPILAIVVVVAVIPYAILDLRQNLKEREMWKEHTQSRRKSWAIKGMLVDTNSAVELRINGLVKYLVDEKLKLDATNRDDEMGFEKKFYLPKLAINVLDVLIEYGALVYVVWQIVLGAIPVGQFVTIRSLLSSLSYNASSLFTEFSSISRDLLNANDFTKFMGLPDELSGDVVLEPSTPPRIEFQHVSFKYPRGEQTVLDDVSFTIEPGEDIAIVGENGAGKTTLVKLLIGVYAPTSGQILIDGTAIDQLDRDSYLRQLGALFQDYSRYHFATLEDNIWYGDITKPRVTAAFDLALDKAGLAGFPARFKKGYKQTLNKDFDKDHGVDLSGGQWQRLALARSFFRSPNILVLDEPTAAVDAKAEYKIFQEIMHQQKDKTTIIISHRFSTVRKAQRILVIDSGKIIEQGTHQELMQGAGLYKEMFELQAAGYRD